MGENILCCLNQNQPPSKITQVAPSAKNYSVGDENVEEASYERTFSSNRTCTDVAFLIFNATFLALTFALLIYCAANSDIDRTLLGYDSCGYVCGKKNTQVPLDGALKPLCADDNPDKSKEGILLLTLLSNSKQRQRHCVETCPNRGFLKVGQQCIETRVVTAEIMQMKQLESFGSSITKALSSLSQCWGEIVAIGLLALLFSSLVVVLIRFAARLVVLTVIFGTILGFLSLSCWLAYKAATSKEDAQAAYGAATCVATIWTIFITLIIFGIRKKIPLVIGIFREASKALADIPSIMAVPVLTITAASVAVAFFIYFVLVIESSGTFVIDGYYEKSALTKFIRFMNYFAYIWMCFFIFSCQDFVIAGAVSKWYYSRIKSSLGFPAMGSLYNLVRYHLGSMSLGSLILAVIRCLQSVLGSEEGSAQNPLACCLQCCCSCVEEILRTLNKNAFIIMSMDGLAFCNAGKRAYHLIKKNLLGIVAVNSVGNFVLELAKIFIVILCCFIGYKIIIFKDNVEYHAVPILFCGLVSLVVSHCFFSVYEMTINTIFLCFCEDCEIHDSLSRPYYMSRSLMHFIQESKTALKLNTPFNFKIPEANSKATV